MMNKIFTYSLFILVTFCCQNIYAQTTVSGVVLDDTDQPLIGVTIIESGTDNGTKGFLIKT